MDEDKTNGIKNDPFIRELLRKLPSEERDSFTDRQLLALKAALGARRRWGRHLIDIRGTIGLWRWRYYYVILGGRERRKLSRRQEQMLRSVKLAFLVGFLTFSSLLGLLIIYLVKSALGIDLIPGFSLGIWDWFKKNVL
ncbi:hypothetical protein DBT_0960 [Dissulfuribacter thermophilus]|uniref:3-phosphoshikimate 1-carboxyvinyltransferase n=1 Tax=Dissulfuribacter thermophilus TaxID=1156395 RepID=A0A1B9F6P3_9BACT|nr:3-phosphoshikimate 1-carboxyvinyltransferase [Dissulfuribacter thermophilus]OCC15609.1 hypothetical protein DBT_0960 [Dissulfuribacter thermophilus]